MRRVRVLHEGASAWGAQEGDDGRPRRRDGAGGRRCLLARAGRAVEDHRRPPHLPLAARRSTACRRMPAEPSYFMKPPSTPQRPPAASCAGRAARGSSTTRASSPSSSATRMHGVAPDDVLDYVYGFAPANDVGLHDFRHADRGSMLRVKGQDGFLPIGPAVVTADEWTPDDGYTLRTYLNGEVVQEADQDDLIWDYRYQLADLCRTITLEPGDVILTGTPANSRPMQPGDVVAVEIERPRPGREHRRRLGRRPERPRRPARGLAEHAARRARDRRGRGRADGRRGEESRDPAAAASTTSASASPTSPTPPAATRCSSGSRCASSHAGRATLACDYEPYSLELVRADDADELGFAHCAWQLRAVRLAGRRAGAPARRRRAVRRARRRARACTTPRASSTTSTRSGPTTTGARRSRARRRRCRGCGRASSGTSTA